MTNLGFILTGAVSIVFTLVICTLNFISYGQTNKKGKKLYGGLTLGGFITLMFITNAFYVLVR